MKLQRLKDICDANKLKWSSHHGVVKVYSHDGKILDEGDLDEVMRWLLNGFSSPLGWDEQQKWRD